ncbi:MAG TPA: sugar phosphate nucleotidyltransferase [Pyrinomonadaceae bacterium]
MNQNTVREFPSLFGRQRKNRLAVILAGGDGSRLRSLTKMITGDECPKQFCPLLGDRTLLDETRDRTALSIPRANTYFSLTQKHEQFYARPLWNVGPGQMIVQPENKGTAPAILYSLMRIASQTADATVAFFPSDHYFSDNEAFMANVESAFAAAELNPDAVVLLGIQPEKAETSYGWIEPTDSLFGELSRSVSRVKKFWEKPTLGVAKKLLEAGCLWNSFVMVGKVDTFLAMVKRHLPDMFRMFAASSRLFGTEQEPAVIRSIYSWLGDTNFSSEVLERSSDDLLVMRVSDVSWSDWGEPQRVIGTLTGLGVETEWMQAVAA